MTSFSHMSLLERLKRLYPPYRRRKDAEMLEAIRELVRDPSRPCIIEGEFIPHGYGFTIRPLRNTDYQFPFE